MEYSPSWEYTSCSATQIPRALWNPKVRYLVHEQHTALITVLSLTNAVRPLLFNTGFKNILPTLLSAPRSCKWSPTFRFHHRSPIFIHILSHTSHVSRQFHHRNNCQEIRPWISSWCYFFQPPATSPAYVMLNVVPLVWKNKVTRPYKIRNKISFLIVYSGS